jgi:hypothetical protein
MTLPKSPKGSNKAEALTFVGTDGEKFFNTQKKISLYPTEATTAQLADNSHVINTAADKVLGRMVFNTTTGVMVFAAGALDGDTWDFYDATTAHTPI